MTVVRSFGGRLRDRIVATSPLCVGIDPSRPTLEQWGLPDTAESLRRFGSAMIEAAAVGGASTVKPQSAYFERLGWQGIRALSDVIGTAHERGLLVILDAKRGDIGTTMEGYAQAYLRPDAPMKVDALTVNPFLGFDTLAPLIDACAGGAGVFLLCRTSNPGAGDIQRSVPPAGGLSLSDRVVAYASDHNSAWSGCGPVGLVVGATVTDNIALSTFNGPVLTPGLGAQGGTTAALAAMRIPHGQLLVSVSRDVSASGPDLHAITDTVRSLVGTIRAAVRP